MSGDLSDSGDDETLEADGAGPTRADAAAAASDGEHGGNVPKKLNWLRAGVLGANDGIVSTAGLVVGVAAATADRGSVFTAGMAGLVAGAVSMSLGEYVSVSTQRDTEKSLLHQERQELACEPEEEFEELVGLYKRKGLSERTARAVAKELSKNDPLAAHADIELGIDPDNLTNPWAAAGSSALSFTMGALIPLVAILLPPVGIRIEVAFVAVLLALALTGTISALLGGSRPGRAVARVVIGGAIAMGVTYAIGEVFGTTVGG